MNTHINKITLCNPSIIMGLMLIALAFPFITSNIYYIDDIGRATQGYTNWGIDGRPFADFLMIALNLNTHLSDLYPLPHIISFCLLFLSINLFRKKLIGNDIFSTFACVSFFSSPFIYEVFTYRFDVLTIIFGSSLCFLFFFVHLKNKYLSFTLQTFILVVILGTYQILVNSFVLLCMIEMSSLILRLKNPKHIIRIVFCRLLQLIISSIIYMKIVIPISFEDTYGDNHPGISHNIIESIVSNSLKYYLFAEKSLFGQNTKYVFIAMTFMAVISSFIISFRIVKKNRATSSYLVMALSIISSFLSLPISMISLLMLSSSIENFPRSYIGLSSYSLYVFALVYMASKVINYRYLSSISLIAFLYGSGYAYAYTNSIIDQDKINRQTILLIKINTQDIPYNTVYPVFNGVAPKSEVMTNSIKNYPLIESMVVNYFSTWYWPHRYWELHGFKQLYLRKSTGRISESIRSMCSFKELRRTQDFILRKKDDILIIDFKLTKCQ